jgi:hypothetical protein
MAETDGQDTPQTYNPAARAEPLTSADLIPDRVLRSEDADAFDYAAIAARVADLVSVAPAPMNVALFGPWGSGKSSFAELLRRSLDERKEKVRLVRYDAWKYGGASLQRNFITHAARELGLDENDAANREFFRGLYEKRRTAEIDSTRLREKWKTLLAWSVGTVLFFSVLFLVALWLIAVFSDKHFSALFSRHYVSFFTSTAVVAVIVSMAKLLLDGLRVDIEQSAPADEEFSATFGRLVKHGLKNYSRIVFFIDELDRCAPEDVVRTLADVKNFLDQPRCIFIVAADREVLEQALTELPQSTPIDEDAPYYSSASAFLDKVFQHEAALPPLRGRRLTRFGRDLVLAQSAHGGLWAELGDAPDNKLVDKVIYALIPSHVRSPRRIKVLLNRFATNARIAQARGIDWLARAEEVAKLTVLQTEFPLLAADLPLEPRLPTLLLSPPGNPAPRLERLLARHRIPTATEPVPASEAATNGSPAEPAMTEPVTTPSATDPLLVEDEEESKLLASVQRLQLRRYLQRTASASVPDPGRDLLYLEPAGAAVGLEDSELGDVIESVAPDARADVLAVLQSRSVDEQTAAARLLADMSHQLFGKEQANVVTTMLGVAEELSDEVRPVADEVAAALRSFLEEQELSEDQLVGALVIARLVEEGQPEQPLTDRLFDDDRLLEDVDRARAVALLPGRLTEPHLEQVRKALAELLPTDASVLVEPIHALPVPTVRSLLTGPVLRNHEAAKRARGFG